MIRPPFGGASNMFPAMDAGAAQSSLASPGYGDCDLRAGDVRPMMDSGDMKAIRQECLTLAARVVPADIGPRVDPPDRDVLDAAGAFAAFVLRDYRGIVTRLACLDAAAHRHGGAPVAVVDAAARYEAFIVGPCGLPSPPPGDRHEAAVTAGDDAAPADGLFSFELLGARPSTAAYPLKFGCSDVPRQGSRPDVP